MSAVLEQSAPVTGEQNFVLYDVAWDTYQHLLENYEHRSSPRFTYDSGVLEIMSPSQPHEEDGRFFDIFVSAICEERQIDVRNLGSTTHRRQDLLKGVEPDCCFYIQHAQAIAGLRSIDLSIYPPPDLVVEVDYTSPSLDRFPIYAALGVPEIWHWDDARAVIYRLAAGHYEITAESLALSGVTAEIIAGFIEASRTLPRYEWMRRVRAWARGL